jgi:molecular chaperone GrpE
MMRKRKKEENIKMDQKNSTNASETGISDQELPENEIIPQSTPTEPGPLASEDSSAAYAELNDKYLRLYSDFDNYRKRTIKEKIELSKYAAADIIGKLLPVLDDFDRAIKSFDCTTEAGKATKDGVLLIFNKLSAILQQQGLQPMRSLGESFDTDFHEAITNIPAPTPEQKGKIVDEIEKGYLLGGKVLRYAKVVVGS